MSNAVSIAQSGANNVTMRNRIINGNMAIDQRYAGTPTANTINGYTLDRWAAYQSVTGKCIVQQNAGSVTPPAGFSSYLGVTSQSAYSILSSDYYFIQQPIEANNIADLAFGTSSAQSVTVSFWVRSSLTGSFGASLGTYNSSSGLIRSIAASYTINSANTWEYKTITFVGDTGGAGIWTTGNGIGIRVNFALGLGSTYTQAAGTWTTGNTAGPTGATSVVGTSGATFYITGVQLEKGSTATPFEQRLYGTELALCQRYYYAPVQASVGDATAALCMGMGYNATTLFGVLPLPNMRVTPTISSSASGTWQWSQGGASYNSNSNLQLQEASPYTFTIAFTVASGATTNAAGWIRRATSAGYVNFSAEL